MNGRELIIYILENGLENEDIFSKEFLKFMPTIERVAVIFKVGTATVDAWIQNDCLQAIEFDGVTYITPDSLKKFAEKVGHTEVEDAK